MQTNAPTQTHWQSNQTVPAGERNTVQAMKRGLFCTCPACGSGKLFKSFLKSVDHCAACGEEMSHHRADDLPAYLSIVLIGHIVLGGFMMTDLVWPVSSWIHLAIWTPLTVILALATIQPIKGAVIGLQWATRMHGFGGQEPKAESGISHPSGNT
ncbi:DUF983 domain-containing protein [Rhizobium sp. KVB221]|uniref:DUF983 domain-containing protein n=1 Tax=Rhizobium setariae TaxID=2801340 RepID=A0A936YVT7_9HYPH|nr:DUF983 domain-containing protein [Rhizobium setariae]MBL0374836.1 DUF983 domain-containing protein [Rhizobium setariae]